MQSVVQFKAGEAAKNLTVTVHLKGFRGLKLRLWVGQIVMRIAIWIVGCNIKFDTET